jgi:hypothetical protein
MSFAESKDASIGAYTQEYPDNKPVEVPPRPAWTGAEPRVAGASTHIDPAEEELKASKEDQRHAHKEDTALLPGDPKEPK